MSLNKFYRYATLYGIDRTMIKVAGRSRKVFLRYYYFKLLIPKKKDVSLIGCGQFGFSTISFFLLKCIGNRFLECFDINSKNEETTSLFWGFKRAISFDDLILNSNCKYVYIASNHSSHCEYALKCIDAGKVIYVEKPIVVNYSQLKRLFSSIKQNNYYGKFFVGYNRPFSSAILKLNEFIYNSKLPITLNCFVIGHFIAKDHWYRNPEEGTRICGNVGHWIDLSINLMNTRGFIPNIFEIMISYSNKDEFDDNISISIITEYHDLVNILITARSEPFEGINESIQFQSGKVIAKIDDFRKIKIWNDERKYSHIFFPKDVGHKLAINQPFSMTIKRNFREIEISTVIMLEIMQMVIERKTYHKISPSDILNELIKAQRK